MNIRQKKKADEIADRRVHPVLGGKRLFTAVRQDVKQFPKPGVLKLIDLGRLEAGFEGIPIKDRWQLLVVAH